MGASFRNTSEIVELAGCDYLTIAPKLLESLKGDTHALERKLSPELAKRAEPLEKISYIENEPKFRWDLLQDAMAFEKLHEGIRKFAEDAVTLKSILSKHL